MQSVSILTPSAPFNRPAAPPAPGVTAPRIPARPADAMQFSSAVLGATKRGDDDDCDRDGGLGSSGLIQKAVAGYTAYKNLEPARSAIEGIKGALGQPGQLPGAALTAGKTFAKAGLFSAALVGGLSLIQHGLKVLSGRESLGSAARQVAVDAAGGLGGGFTATALAGLGGVLLGALGVTGVGLTIASVVIGVLGYGSGERIGRSLARSLVG